MTMSDGVAGTEDLKEMLGVPPGVSREYLLVRLVNRIFQMAVERKATAVIFEPSNRGTGVWLKLGGVRTNYMQLPSFIHYPLISRLKSMSRIDITEKNMPQVGVEMLHVGNTPACQAKFMFLPASLGTICRVELRMDRMIDLSSVREELRDLVKRDRGVIVCAAEETVDLADLLRAVVRDKEVASHPVLICDFNRLDHSPATVIWPNQRNGYSFETILETIIDFDYDLIVMERPSPAAIANAFQLRQAVMIGLLNPLDRHRASEQFGLPRAIFENRAISTLTLFEGKVSITRFSGA